MSESGEQGAIQPLHKKYPTLYKSKEVTHAAARQSKVEGKPLTQPDQMIGTYLADLEQIHIGKRGSRGEIIPPDPAKRERIKGAFHNTHLIKPENVTDDYIRGVLLGNFAEAKGYDRDKLTDPKIKNYIKELFEKEIGQDLENYHIPQDQKDQVVTQTIEDQRASFDSWYDYLTSEEARAYPTSFKYWAFTEVVKMGGYDRGKKEFSKRTDRTISAFPDLNRQALSLVLDEVIRKHFGEPSRLNLDEAQKQEFQTRLKGESFNRLYGWAIDYVNSLKLPKDRLPMTAGTWREFRRGSDPKLLADSLSSFNTEWCIAGEGTAASYLTDSDIHIYYSEDDQGNPTIPRAAVVTDGTKISEVRGIMQKGLAKQHLDDYIAPVVAEKLAGLPGGAEWQSAMVDMQRLAEIHFKDLQGNPLTKDDLVFLYELDHPISSTGYDRDPRIDEIRGKRNPLEDTPLIFECRPEQIASSEKELNQDTKAYIGPLFPGIFDKLRNIEYIYTSFPEGKIVRERLQIGGKTPENLIHQLKSQNVYTSDYVQDMLKNKDFTTLSKPEDIGLIRLKVRDLGFTDFATTDQLFAKIKEYGLELCPAETGPQYRLTHMDQPKGDYIIIGMQPITDRGYGRGMFIVSRSENGRWLYDRWVRPDSRWDAQNQFVFRL